MQSELFQIETETTWEDLGNGVQRKIYGYDDKIMLVKAKFEAGAIGPLHEHYHVQVTYVESGVFEMTIGDEKKSSEKAMVIMCHLTQFMVAYVLNQEF